MTDIRVPAEKRIDESMNGCPAEIAADQCFTLSAMEWDEIKAELNRLRGCRGIDHISCQHDLTKPSPTIKPQYPANGLMQYWCPLCTCWFEKPIALGSFSQLISE